MRTLSGIYQSVSGSIVFDGRDIARLPSHDIVAAGLSQASEGRQIFYGMSIEDNLSVGLPVSPTPRSTRRWSGRWLAFLSCVSA